MRPEQTVTEMAQEVLNRRAKTLVEGTACSFEAAMEAVSKTSAGRQLRELTEGPSHDERARDWQVGLAREREEEERRYRWIEGYVEWLDGKEARAGYYTRLEELASLRG